VALYHNIRLPHDETDECKRYVMPDPGVLYEAYRRVREQAYPTCARSLIEPAATMMNFSDLKAVLSLAAGYLDLTTYTLGQERCVGKLRDIWRARRARWG